MIIAVFGESCTGKSTLTAKLKEMLSAEEYSGKDYLRQAKNEADAEMKFRNLLKETQAADSILIDVISEPEQLKLLPAGCLRVLVTADLEQIEARFAKRTTIWANAAFPLKKPLDCSQFYRSGFLFSTGKELNC